MEAVGMIDPGFWAGRRVLLTGHTGFKGAWLALWLRELGAEVYGFALPPPSDPSLYTLACGGALARDTMGDVRDLAAVRAAYAEARPDVVLHLAAQALVRPSFEDPVGTYATNVLGTVHVLEGCAELVTSAYRRSFFAVTPDDNRAAVASARAGNVVGGGDWALDRIVPDCVRAFLAGEKVALRNPQATRPWQHVLEPLAGYLLLAERLATAGTARVDFADAWNFGPSDSDALPVGELVEILAQHWGEGAGWVDDSAPKPHEAHYLKVDSSKARARLGWRPVLGVQEALAWCADWYRRQATGEAALNLCLEQIARYQARMSPARMPLPL